MAAGRDAVADEVAKGLGRDEIVLFANGGEELQNAVDDGPLTFFFGVRIVLAEIARRRRVGVLEDGRKAAKVVPKGVGALFLNVAVGLELIYKLVDDLIDDAADALFRPGFEIEFFFLVHEHGRADKDRLTRDERAKQDGAPAMDAVSPRELPRAPRVCSRA